MDFLKQKKQFLSKPDKSSAGGIDRAIIPLCRKINKNPDYYTTSSCAGRIILIKETGKKQENAFIKVWHDKISMKELLNALKNAKYKKIIYLKHEPCIMHVSCRTLSDAEKLVQLARHCGWKKSGIISLGKNIAELNSTEILAAPVMNNKILADNAYLNVLVKEANKKLRQTREKIKNLENSLK